MTNNVGFAAVNQHKEILIDTVSSTERAAMVNWLVLYGRMMVYSSDTDGGIAELFQKKACQMGLAVIEPVKIERTQP